MGRLLLSRSRNPAVVAAIGVGATLLLALHVVVVLLSGNPKAVSDNATVIAGLIISGGVFTVQMVTSAIADRRAEEARLQNYFAEVGKLLIEQPLRQASPGDNLSTVVRAQTLAALEVLGPDHTRMLLQFLYDSDLIRNDNPVVSLLAANLRGANLSGTNVVEANLSNADLSGAKVTEAQLRAAGVLDGAIMPDGTKHPKIRLPRNPIPRTPVNKALPWSKRKPFAANTGVPSSP